MTRLVLPYQPLPAPATSMLADRLEQVLSLLPKLGITVSAASRLPQAVKVLRSVHAAGQYPSDHAELIRVGNAIKAAFNFVRIIDAIMPPGPPGVLSSLKRALKGKLDDTAPTEAYQGQSELFFGVAIVAGGIKTGTPQPGPGKTPDFVAEVDTARYSVEVKRPGSIDVIKESVAAAVRQIREYKSYPALVALDLSDTLPVAFGVTDLAQAEGQNWSVFRVGYAKATGYMGRRAGDEGYDHVAVLYCFAESFLWTAPCPQPMPHSALMSYAEVYPGAYAGLIVDQSRRLTQRVFLGFKELGGSVRRLTRVP